MSAITAPIPDSFDLGPLAPAGTFVATCLCVKDQFKVSRTVYNDPSKTEFQDVTRFLFGFSHENHIYKVQTYEYRISGSPKSNLIIFLTSWLGGPPKVGWDYCSLVGTGAMISVAHKLGRNSKTFAALASISPVMAQLQAQVLPLSAFGEITPPRSASAAVAPAVPVQNSTVPPKQQNPF
jgi:hypothetical protein